MSGRAAATGRAPRAGRRGSVRLAPCGRPPPTGCSSASCATRRHPAHLSHRCPAPRGARCRPATAVVTSMPGELLDGASTSTVFIPAGEVDLDARRRSAFGMPTRTVGMPRLRRMLASVAPLVAGDRARARVPATRSQAAIGAAVTQWSGGCGCPGWPATSSVVHVDAGSARTQVVVARRELALGRRAASCRDSAAGRRGRRQHAGMTAAIRRQPAAIGGDDALRRDRARACAARRTRGTTSPAAPPPRRRRRSGCRYGSRCRAPT